MPFKIVRNDITKVKADAIVNTANPKPVYAGGTDSAIYHAAGAEKLLEERKKIGCIERGEVAVTDAFALNAKYIIHTVGPEWADGEHDEFKLLENCYIHSLEKALELGCESIAFPLISTGVYGFPKDKALQIAVSVFSRFLLENEMQIILVNATNIIFKAAEKLSFDEHKSGAGILDYDEKRVLTLCGANKATWKMNKIYAPEHITDDTVMTVAIAEALIAVGVDATKKEIEEAIIANMQDWGRRYSYAGYGGRFRYWLTEANPKPYNSYGNGSAMIVSAAGWLYPTLERTREVAVYTAEVTHNHPEGIKGAEATASCIFLSRHGANKGQIKEYVEKEFGYNLNRTLDEIKPTFQMDESCQRTVPEAIIAFLESEDYEDAVRNAVSLGGDTDTLATITGSIAEAYYDMSAILRAECRSRVSDDIIEVMELFDNAFGSDC